MEHRQFENSLCNQYEEYYDEQWEEWHADLIYTPEKANRETNAYHRYRLFTFSNFLTTLDTVSTYQANVEDILSDAHAGSVLLTIGARGGSYPVIRKRMARMALAVFDSATMLAATSVDAQLDRRLCEEIRRFYRHLKLLAGELPPLIALT